MPVAADGLDGEVVVGVEEGEVLDVEEGDDVVPVPLEDGDAGVAVVNDVGDHLDVERGVGGEHEDVVDGRHDVRHRLLVHLQGPRHDLYNPQPVPRALFKAMGRTWNSLLAAAPLCSADIRMISLRRCLS